uniref:Uncharacterized protein n=1 Tax=Parascaris univalens TaxID=6257 RepID=A0A915AJU5_PARUN
MRCFLRVIDEVRRFSSPDSKSSINCQRLANGRKLMLITSTNGKACGKNSLLIYEVCKEKSILSAHSVYKPCDRNIAAASIHSDEILRAYRCNNVACCCTVNTRRTSCCVKQLKKSRSICLARNSFVLNNHL